MAPRPIDSSAELPVSLPPVAMLGRLEEVLTASVKAEESPLGTLSSRGPLMGVVARVGRTENQATHPFR